MSEHLIIYLDEAGDLGFDTEKKKTSRYLIIVLLVCMDAQAHKGTMRSVKKTLKNKLEKNTMELKGRNIKLPVKEYFLKQMRKVEDWGLYIAITDKKTWIAHHNRHHSHELKKKVLYDEVARRIFSQIDILDTASRVDIVVDRSKNKYEIAEFNDAVARDIKTRLSKNAVLTIRHAYSHEEAGLQAVDMFCTGIHDKYEKNDIQWYTMFSDKIAAEVTYRY